MAHHSPGNSHSALTAALRNPDPSVRLAAALSAGTTPQPDDLALLVARCAIEPDFFVRDMLTWALTRHVQAQTLPLLLAELESPLAQARSQALHTLSKIGDPAAWPAITSRHLHDPDPEVARSAWRAAAGLAPASQRTVLAQELLLELGRGDLELKRSLSRALAMLADVACAPLRAAASHELAAVRIHARATLRLIADPESTFVLDPADAHPGGPSSPLSPGLARPPEGR